jgi:hypothetical protein
MSLRPAIAQRPEHREERAQRARQRIAGGEGVAKTMVIRLKLTRQSAMKE